jgi:hypothetical protein
MNDKEKALLDIVNAETEGMESRARARLMSELLPMFGPLQAEKISNAIAAYMVIAVAGNMIAEEPS